MNIAKLITKTLLIKENFDEDDYPEVKGFKVFSRVHHGLAHHGDSVIVHGIVTRKAGESIDDVIDRADYLTSRATRHTYFHGDQDEFPEIGQTHVDNADYYKRTTKQDLGHHDSIHPEGLADVFKDIHEESYEDHILHNKPYDAEVSVGAIHHLHTIPDNKGNDIVLSKFSIEPVLHPIVGEAYPGHKEHVRKIKTGEAPYEKDHSNSITNKAMLLYHPKAAEDRSHIDSLLYADSNVKPFEIRKKAVVFQNPHMSKEDLTTAMKSPLREIRENVALNKNLSKHKELLDMAYSDPHNGVRYWAQKTHGPKV